MIVGGADCHMMQVINAVGNTAVSHCYGLVRLALQPSKAFL